MDIISTQVSIIRWCGTEEDFRTQIVSARLAIFAYSTRNTWFNCNSIAYQIKMAGKQ